MSRARAKLAQIPVLEIIQSAVKTATRYQNRQKNMYEILNTLPRNGVATLFRKKQWNPPDSYITVTDVDLSLVSFSCADLLIK
jgi:hypothetical protein